MSRHPPSWLRSGDAVGESESGDDGTRTNASDQVGSRAESDDPDAADANEPESDDPDDAEANEPESDDPDDADVNEPELEQVREALIDWYEAGHRSFPWRETTDPYPILVSEVMSQQTQLGRVVDAYEDFLERWPTVGDLAEADRGAVVAFWSDHSLGYNNRAKYLHEAAGQVIEEYDGEFPREPAELEELMGVGPYTANAVASFAFDNGDAVVDTNVKRVLYRAFGVEDEDRAFETAARRLMPDGDSRVWNNAIMELGGVACGQRPQCDEEACPWRAWCHAYQTGDFTAPDVPEQPEFEGSRRQMRGRVVRTLGEYGELSLDELGPRVRVDYAPGGEHGREWLRGLVTDLADDGLAKLSETNGKTVVRLRE